ncbi:hypothetical protein HDU76_011308, partial [Blyttiomyces sp. JEL0837]
MPPKRSTTTTKSKDADVAPSTSKRGRPSKSSTTADSEYQPPGKKAKTSSSRDLFDTADASSADD